MARVTNVCFCFVAARRFVWSFSSENFKCRGDWELSIGTQHFKVYWKWHWVLGSNRSANFAWTLIWLQEALYRRDFQTRRFRVRQLPVWRQIRRRIPQCAHQLRRRQRIDGPAQQVHTSQTIQLRTLRNWLRVHFSFISPMMVNQLE